MTDEFFAISTGPHLSYALNECKVMLHQYIISIKQFIFDFDGCWYYMVQEHD